MLGPKPNMNGPYRPKNVAEPKTSEKKEVKNILIVADSISNCLDRISLEKATGCNVTISKAYTVDDDPKAKTRAKNFYKIGISI